MTGFAWCAAAGVFAVAFLLGSTPWGVIISRIFYKRDLRNYGSGNAGLTNAYRTMGAKKTLFVLLGDIAKGAAAVSVGWALGGPVGKLTAGIFVILGHMFPLYFGFKGGKGVLVGAVMLAFFDWRVFVIAFALFILSVVLTKWISLGSILGTVIATFWGLVIFGEFPDVFTILGALVIIGSGLYVWSRESRTSAPQTQHPE